MKLNLLVIRTQDPQLLKEQYELLGFNFEYHQHGNGPFHYASEENRFVFEIYPLSTSADLPDNSLRLGFETPELLTVIEGLKKSTWKIISLPKENEWGFSALLQDLDGRKVEVTEITN